MPEHLNQARPLSHAQTLREEAGRRLSRSPHPYHRQQSEISYSSDRLNPNVSPTQSPSRSTDLINNEERASSRQSLARAHELNSDSGTEADDEHFLKGLPAPKVRPHKGLRDAEGSLSSSPSPVLSPAILEDDIQGIPAFLRKPSAALAAQNEEDARRGVEKGRRLRRVEIVRRITEAAILLLVGGILCLDSEVRVLLNLGAKGMQNIMPGDS